MKTPHETGRKLYRYIYNNGELGIFAAGGLFDIRDASAKVVRAKVAKIVKMYYGE